jgi:Spy/CpxP family protein refolding chaperone
MSRLICVSGALVLWCASAGFANAQPGRGPGSPGPLRPEVLERIVDDLKLSEKERARADEILEAHHETMRRARDEARANLLEQMKAVLTPAQLAQFKQELDRRGPPPLPRNARRGVSVELLVDHVMSFDKNKDGKVTRDELPDRLHYLFDKSLGEKDGGLTRQQVEEVAAKMNQNSPDSGAANRPRPPRP